MNVLENVFKRAIEYFGNDVEINPENYFNIYLLVKLMV